VSASTQADFSRDFSAYAWMLGVLFAFTVLAIAAMLVRFRSGRESEASTVTGSRVAEGGAVLAFALIAALLIARTFSIENGGDSLAAGPAVRVDVVAYQWGWLGKAAKCLHGAGAALVALAGTRRSRTSRLGAAFVLAGSASERLSILEAGRQSATDPAHTVRSHAEGGFAA
jgi:heme/copper-type cytochrome/quinol oxidase subunit 2